MTCMYPAANHY